MPSGCLSTSQGSNGDGSRIAWIEHLCYSQDVDLIDRLRLAAEGAIDEAADQHDRRLTAAMPACGAAPRPVLKTYSHKGRDIPIYPAAGPGGRRFPLLKAMLTTVCERDCNYCSFRAGRDQRRVTFRPEEMAAAFAEAHRRGLVQGLFLSAGIVTGGVNTQERLNATAVILRQRYGFAGYIHLKIMPGAEPDQVQRAMSIASRVSINLEAPNALRLPILAPHKSFDDELIPPLRWAETHRQAHAGPTRLASSATQFVVGAAGEADLEILATVEHAYRNFGLSRAFFSLSIQSSERRSRTCLPRPLCGRIGCIRRPTCYGTTVSILRTCRSSLTATSPSIRIPKRPPLTPIYGSNPLSSIRRTDGNCFAFQA